MHLPSGTASFRFPLLMVVFSLAIVVAVRAGDEVERHPVVGYASFNPALSDDDGFCVTVSDTSAGTDDLRPVSLMQPKPFLTPLQEIQPQVPLPSPSAQLMADRFAGEFASRDRLPFSRRGLAVTPEADVIFGSDAEIRVSTDAGDLLGSSPSALGLQVQRRTPIVTDPRVRGTRGGQLVAQGSYWIPARQDLDTLVSKLDSRLVDEVIVVKGPYSVLYGPGFGFIDVELQRAPRFSEGYQWHGRTCLEYQQNGARWYGRQDVWAGSQDWGFRAGYGNRTGDDYQTGAGVRMPTGYHSQDVSFCFGFDLTSEDRLEISHLQLDQSDVEFPAQMFDISYLGTKAVDCRYVHEDCCYTLTVDGGFNQTRLRGDTANLAKGIVQPIEASLAQLFGDPADTVRFFGVTSGEATSGSGRAFVVSGDPDSLRLTLGADLRLVRQQLSERFVIARTSLAPPEETEIGTGLPNAYLINPGLFMEAAAHMSSQWDIRIGGRVDWVRTEASEADLRSDTSLVGRLRSDDTLPACFLSNEIHLTDVHKLILSCGYAERPPTLTERYADGVSLGLIQSGLSRVIGDPELRKERLWQLDAGIEADCEILWARASIFQAWVFDYATYGVAPIAGLTGARLLHSVNSALATLSGGEVRGELPLTASLRLYGSLVYVVGTDQEIDAPLGQISPLEGRLGSRFSTQDPNWGVEFAARFVQHQHRLGTYRQMPGNGQVVTLEDPTPGFTVWDLRGYWHVTERLSLAAGVENLLNTNYQEHLDYRTGAGLFQPGVNGYLSVELHY